MSVSELLGSDKYNVSMKFHSKVFLWIQNAKNGIDGEPGTSVPGLTEENLLPNNFLMDK